MPEIEGESSFTGGMPAPGTLSGGDLTIASPPSPGIDFGPAFGEQSWMPPSIGVSPSAESTFAPAQSGWATQWVPTLDIPTYGGEPAGKTGWKKQLGDFGKGFLMSLTNPQLWDSVGEALATKYKAEAYRDAQSIAPGTTVVQGGGAAVPASRPTGDFPPGTTSAREFLPGGSYAVASGGGGGGTSLMPMLLIGGIVLIAVVMLGGKK